MQTNFSLTQLADSRISEADSILRNCVHCGFCVSTCPTYVLLGNELDSPRGRIYLIKDMLESGRPVDSETVTHIDRCLSCYSCMTTCPSGVNYKRLVDTARLHIERTYRRRFLDRLLRFVLLGVMTYPFRFKLAIRLGSLVRPFSGLLTRLGLRSLGSVLSLIPRSVSARHVTAPTYSPSGDVRGRVALLTGCIQPVLDDATNKATIDLLTRFGIEVVVVGGCCGALDRHLGVESLDRARALMQLLDEERTGAIDAIIMTVSGCGTFVKDLGHLLRDDELYSVKAERVSSLTRDITEYVADLDIPSTNGVGLKVAYHGACSLQHGQGVTDAPRALLTQAGFEVFEPSESHLCCGSAGVYNILEASLSSRLRDRKVDSLEALGADVITSGNIGCLSQISSGTDLPVVHISKLLNWAYGGDRPYEFD